MFSLYYSEFSHYAKQIIEIQFWLTTKEDSTKQICLGCVAGWVLKSSFVFQLEFLSGR